MTVVVTGIGVISAAGAGYGAFGEALSAGALPLSEVPRAGGHHRAGPHPLGGAPARAALLVPGDAWRGWIAPMKARRMSGPSRFAVAAARMALADAGLSAGDDAATTTLTPDVDASRVAVSVGTAFGSTEVTYKILNTCVEPGPEAISPALFTESVASAHAGQVALELGCRASNATVTQGEASGALAVARGADLIDAGRADVVLAGGVDEASELLHAVLDRLGALARDHGAGERARPFDRRRTGFLLAEGGVMLVLEDEAHAAGRGATALARLRGRVRAFDPSAAPGTWGTGAERLATRLTEGLARAGVDRREVSAIAASASGSRRGDALEAGVLARAFGDRPPPVAAPKASCGEFGAFGLAAGLHLAGGGSLADPADPFEPDPDLGTLVPDGAGPDGGVVLSGHLASGGPAVWLAWEGETRA